MSWRNYNEIAIDSFLFFEATGDSELANDSDINLGNIQDSADAESCSYDSDDHLVLDFQEDNECDNDNFSEDTDHDAEFNSYEHEWCGQMMVLSKAEEEEGEGEVESRPAGNRNVEILTVDEMEKNRIFWETCLQGGYP
ncbi:glutamic acid-rich protein-like [Heracleum sosnowskyi]|uniref:Glutamic acid-rich protein-like n=1 Tax=Heracleum sosnowskyi TaxID=360622 RepID=A0AAD8J194_9APIA|nr:glutamic acid-rich protein-like [Heracleum sosnowskyi]